jgi:hypothetical protein
MFQTKVVQQIRHKFYVQQLVFRKSCSIWHSVKKDDRATQVTDDNTVRHMRSACWILKAPDAHPEHGILIALPLQQWLHERASTLRYKYTASLVKLWICMFNPLLQPSQSTRWNIAVHRVRTAARYPDAQHASRASEITHMGALADRSKLLPKIKTKIPDQGHKVT